MQPNIILIVLDTARAETVFSLIDDGHLPTLESITEEGVSFTSAFTTAPWTLPSHASLFTGQRTSDHNTHAGTKRFDPHVPTLAEQLSNGGYDTVGISGNVWVSKKFGFHRGFDNLSMKWDYYWTDADLSSVSEANSKREMIRAFTSEVSPRELPKTIVNAAYGKYLSKSRQMGGANTTRRVTKWLRNREPTDDPFFFFVNYLEPHLEYWPPDRYLEQFLPDDVTPEEVDRINQDPWEYIAGHSELTDRELNILLQLYKGELAYVDELVGGIYRTLRECDLLEDTCLIVVGDHGENIGDHNLMDHQYCLYDTLLNVPLFVRYPEVFQSGTTVDELVEVRDLYPTLLDLAGIELPSTETISTQSFLREEYREYVIGEYRAPQPSMESMDAHLGELPETIRRYDRTLRSIRDGRWKTIEGSDGSAQLYDVVADPTEEHDLSAEHPDIVADHITQMDDENTPLSYVENEKGNIDEHSRKHLESLGYL
ncbi:sulfatase family protein [Natronobiforma cellulositropha]|uniref:sulfatase family protein n=1 Tax=Natronobiforma cellulositropha TaxID=1679076 RepID=UPI0021D573CF|nr:sulfatase [Natronobiforma cellulositropha]